MERCFIVTKESEYNKRLMSHIELEKQQKKFINKFFTEKNIEAESYRICGGGGVNQPFDECNKRNIKLDILPTKNDLNNFGKMLCKPNKHGLCSFKKNSPIGKEFAQRCIDEKVVINLYSPRVSHYFKSLGICGCGYQTFRHSDTLYLKVVSDYLKTDDSPEGFTEIKLSEYYKVEEEMESGKSNEEENN